MNVMQTLPRWSDPYDREARLYPGLLTIAPVIVLFLSVFGAKHPLLMTAVSLLVACGGPLLLSRIARDQGKALEDRLNAQWGGKPTTILLRHKDTTINALTKKEYHRVIGQGLSRNPPTAGLEAKNLEQADTFYRAGTAWLIAKTQDTKKHTLLFKENKNYGFQRNLRGLKWIGILICLLTLLASIGHFYVQSGESGTIEQVLRSVSVAQMLPLTVSAAMLLSWIFLVTDASVQRAGFAYADRLLRTCDVLKEKVKPARK